MSVDRLSRGLGSSGLRELLSELSLEELRELLAGDAAEALRIGSLILRWSPPGVPGSWSATLAVVDGEAVRVEVRFGPQITRAKAKEVEELTEAMIRMVRETE